MMYYRLIVIVLFFVLLIPQDPQLQVMDTTDEKGETVEDYLSLASIYHLRSLDKALEYSNKALELAKVSGQEILIAKAFKNLGVTNYYLTQYTEAVLCFDSALNMFARTGDSVEIANIHNNLGIIYSDIGQPLKALDYLLRSLSYRKRMADSIGIGHGLNNIGAIYYDIKAYGEALTYFEQAYKISSSLGNYGSSLSTLNNIGLIQLEKGLLNDAMYSFRQCIELSVKLNDVVGKANALNNLGELYLLRSSPDSALHYYFLAEATYAQVSRSSGETLNGIGRSYFAKADFQKAADIFNRALKLAQETGNKSLELDIQHNLFEAYFELGMKDKALNSLISYHKLFSEVKSLFDSTALSNTHARFMVEKKFAEIESLEREKIIQDKLVSGQRQTIRFQHIALTVAFFALFLFLTLLLIAHKLNLKLKKSGGLLEEKNKEAEKSRELLSKLNEELTAQKELLLTLIHATPDLICFKDGQGKWLQANKSILEVFGLEGVDYVGRSDSELALFSPFHKPSLETCELTDEITWQKRVMSRSDELIPQPDGIDKVFDVIKVPLYHQDGSRKGLIVLGRNITERKNAENQLFDALHRAEESDKLKSAFLANISHEIRTPLNAIIGFSEILKDTAIEANEKQHFLSLISDNGHLLLKLITDIIDLSRIEAGETKLIIQPVNLNNMFREVFGHFKEQFFAPELHKFVFELNIPDETIVCEADEVRLRQIIQQLLDNAFKFTEEGSVELGFECLHENLHFWICDTGPGIPLDMQEMVFKRFIKLSNSGRRFYGGTGLGLSIAEQMVRLMGGKLWFESMVEKGTIFHVSIPLKLYKENPQRSEFHNPIKYNFTNKNILVVEDVESSFELLKLLIEPTGAQVLRAVDGKQAVDLCFTQSDIDLVLMDIHLPLMNGLEATRLIKKRLPNLPIVAQTAYALSDEKEACFEAGCDGYLAKPIRSSFLLPVIGEILNMNS